MKKDYLKYWKVVREYTKYEHGLSAADLDMLLFLYSEKYFTKPDFEEYHRVFSWNKKRFQAMRRDGWIDMFREYDPGKNQAALYRLSTKAKRVVNTLYERLEGKMLPERGMKQKGLSFSQNRIKEAVARMNQVLQQQRHHPRE